MPGGSSNKRANDSVSFGVEDLKCVACEEILRDVIYQCRKGHLLHGKCRNSLLDVDGEAKKCI